METFKNEFRETLIKVEDKSLYNRVKSCIPIRLTSNGESTADIHQTVIDYIAEVIKDGVDDDLHKNRQERCHPLGWQYELPKSPIDNHNITIYIISQEFYTETVETEFSASKKIKIGGAIKNTECLEQASAEVSTS